MYADFFYSVWEPIFNQYLSSSSAVVSAGFYWGTSRGVQSSPELGIPPGGFPGTAPGYPVFSERQVLVSKRSSTMRYPRGRLWLGNVSDAWLDADWRLNPAGKAAVTPFATQLLTPLTVGTVTFTPTCFRPLADAMDPVVETRVGVRTLIRRKRRLGRKFGNDFLVTFQWDWYV
jgi:hypothetical protein